MVDVKAQVLFQFLVHPFRLAVSLWVISHGGVIFDTHQPIEIDCEFSLELGPSIVNYFGGNPMQAKHIVPE